VVAFASDGGKKEDCAAKKNRERGREVGRWFVFLSFCRCVVEGQMKFRLVGKS